MAQPKPTGEIQNPNPGDNVVSTCGIIKVTIASDGSLPVTKLVANKRGSFNIQLYYAGREKPDTVVFRTDDPAVPPYRLDSSAKLLKLKIVTNPV
jgi:hypothetical protein